MSNRNGNDDIFVLDLATGDTRRITFDDATDHLDAWSRDGKWLYFSSTSRDISGMNDVYRVSADGGTPMIVAGDRFAAEYWAAPAPSGDVLAITAKGIVAGQWWRHGHSHIDESEIWKVAFSGDHPKYERISGGGAKEEWPMWSADGKRLYFVSDRSGAENLWVKDDGARTARQLTTFAAGRLLWPSISYDGKAIVFERDFGVWKYDVASGKAAAVDITLRGAPAGPGVTRLSATSGFSDLALSPDGKKVAFGTHGELFAASSKDGGTAARVSNTPANEEGPRWAPDSRRLVYVSDRGGAYHLFLYDFTANTETQITHDPEGEADPAGRRMANWSPSFVAGGRSSRMMSHRNRSACWHRRTSAGRPAARLWSGRQTASGSHSRRRVNVRSTTSMSCPPRAAHRARPISFVPNTSVQSIAWSPDGTYLLFTTGQRTEPSAVVRVDLVPKTPKFREDEFRDLFKENPKTPGDAGRRRTERERARES